MTTIKLQLPDDLAQRISRLTGNIEVYIVEVLRNKIKEADAKQLSELASEYQMTAIENEAIIKDFSHTDFEHWDDQY